MKSPIHAPLSIEDIAIGDELPSLVKGPLTPSHLVRWAAAMENWHRIHFDWRYATAHDGLPDVVVNGSWKQHVLLQLVTDWAGECGWLWTIAFQFRGMNVPSETLTAWGRVTAIEERGAYGLARLDIGLRNERGEESTPGTAVTVWPTLEGPPVPYPFDPRAFDSAVPRSRA
jgi:acyl dehydratase